MNFLTIERTVFTFVGLILFSTLLHTICRRRDNSGTKNERLNCGQSKNKYTIQQEAVKGIRHVRTERQNKDK
jgi:hypothetical protein